MPVGYHLHGIERKIHPSQETAFAPSRRHDAADSRRPVARFVLGEDKPEEQREREESAPSGITSTSVTSAYHRLVRTIYNEPRRHAARVHSPSDNTGILYEAHVCPFKLAE